MKVDWTPQAQANLRSILEYIARDSPAAATRITRLIVAKTNRLADHPEIGRRGRVRDTRERVITGTPYVVIYVIEGGVISIVRVIHGAQRWPPR